MGTNNQTNGWTRTNRQIFTQYSGISSHSLRGVWICINYLNIIVTLLGQRRSNERLLLFRGINPDVAALGQRRCMEHLPFFIGAQS
jgi:hypothetical protein